MRYAACAAFRLGMTENSFVNKSISEGNIAHAYIVECADAERLERFAADFIEAVGAHAADVYYMEQTGKTAYRVEDASGMLERLAMRPYGDRIIAVVRNADALSEVVQNKLLKTLEEPFPGTVILLLVSSRSALIETVRSRCVPIRLSEYDAPADGTGKKYEEAADLLLRGEFHRYRNYVEKEIKAREEALMLLDSLETASAESVRQVKLIEMTRMDIMRGMGHKQALKRLYLEING